MRSKTSWTSHRLNLPILAIPGFGRCGDTRLLEAILVNLVAVCLCLNFQGALLILFLLITTSSSSSGLFGVTGNSSGLSFSKSIDLQRKLLGRQLKSLFVEQ
jgi:hypothetical protein